VRDHGNSECLQEKVEERTSNLITLADNLHAAASCLTEIEEYLVTRGFVQT